MGHRLWKNGIRKKEDVANVACGVCKRMEHGVLLTAAGSGSEPRLEALDCVYTELQGLRALP